MRTPEEVAAEILQNQPHPHTSMMVSQKLPDLLADALRSYAIRSRGAE